MQQSPPTEGGEKSLNADEYIETYVHPVLEPLGDVLARTMPEDIEDFLDKWLTERVALPLFVFPVNWAVV